MVSVISGSLELISSDKCNKKSSLLNWFPEEEIKACHPEEYRPKSVSNTKGMDGKEEFKTVYS